MRVLVRDLAVCRLHNLTWAPFDTPFARTNSLGPMSRLYLMLEVLRQVRARIRLFRFEHD